MALKVLSNSAKVGLFLDLYRESIRRYPKHALILLELADI